MACYRNGGCGPYEDRACNECPASKPEYLNRGNVVKPKRVDELKPTIKIKIFIGEDGISCAMKDTDLPVEIEVIDEEAVKHSAQYDDEPNVNGDELVDAYINQICGDGFVYIDEEKIVVTNDL
jgi:hypothetical protein